MNHANMNHAKNHAKVMVRLGMAAAILGLAGAAPGQNEWLVDITYSDPAEMINSLDDTATVTLWAAWDADYYAFAKGALDVTADDPVDMGIWSDPESLLPLYKKNGTINGESITGIESWQLHFPEAGIFADTANPIAVWRATWQAADLSHRLVPVTSSSAMYAVYVDQVGNSSDFIDSLHEGAGEIKVVPGPGALAMLTSVFIAGHGWRHRHHR